MNHICPWGTALLIGVKLSSNTQFSVVLDPQTSLKRGQKILVPLLERGIENLSGTSIFTLLVKLVQHGGNKPPLRVRQFLMGGTPIAFGVSPWEKTGLPHHSKSM
ncbi:MAG: hypothetical protein V7K68_18830, partial [Nostoc sp.]|uniref:hypothetical protein n=1 Tax=Nostoc sp. TaxID=1180 RepID=UPI002FF576BC